MSLAAVTALSVSLALIPTSVEHPNISKYDKLIEKQSNRNYTVIYEFNLGGDNSTKCQVKIKDNGDSEVECYSVKQIRVN